jgi:hypothetical protein
MVMLDRLTVVFVFNTNLSYLNPAAAFNLKFHLDEVSASLVTQPCSVLSDTRPEIVCRTEHGDEASHQ